MYVSASLACTPWLAPYHPAPHPHTPKQQALAPTRPRGQEQGCPRVPPARAGEEDMDEASEFEEGRVIVVTSGKGGVGK